MPNRGLVKSLPISLPQSSAVGSGGGGGGMPPFQLSGTLPDGDQGTNYDGVLGISGGVAPYNTPAVASGTLPADFSLSIVGNVLHVIAIAPIAFSGVVSCSLTVKDSAAHTTASYPVTFTINVANFIATEAGDILTTESGDFLITDS